MSRLSVYTRQCSKEDYPFGLASAVHFALEKDGDKILLNNNYGILFAAGEISQENTIIPLGIEDPVMFRTDDGSIEIAAKRIRDFGKPYEADGGRLWAWRTKDLMHFETLGLVEASGISGKDASLEIDDALAERITEYWNPSAPVKEPGVPQYTFPLAEGYGDPVIFAWEGKWYYISTNDNLDDIGIYVREADTVPELFAPGITEHLILPYDEERELIQTFWAPEFHVIGGDLYILFAVSGRKWGPQCHLMRFKKGGRITDPESWEDPVRIVKKDGSYLADSAITLDMTYINAEGRSYVVWSYREHIGTAADTGSMLYIATIDEAEPYKLTNDPVLLSRPLFGWENLEGTINNEGPNAYIRDGKVYLTYSGGAANGYTYAVGLFTADTDADLLDTSSWTKSIPPVLSYYSVDEFGPGHNSFFRDEKGDLYIAYHGETELKEHLRCDMIRKVYYKEDGIPYFV